MQLATLPPELAPAPTEWRIVTPDGVTHKEHARHDDPNTGATVCGYVWSVDCLDVAAPDAFLTCEDCRQGINGIQRWAERAAKYFLAKTRGHVLPSRHTMRQVLVGSWAPPVDHPSVLDVVTRCVLGAAPHLDIYGHGGGKSRDLTMGEHDPEL